MIQKPSDFVRKIKETKEKTNKPNKYLSSASNGVKQASSGYTLHVFTKSQQPGSDQVWKGEW